MMGLKSWPTMVETLIIHEFHVIRGCGMPIERLRAGKTAKRIPHGRRQSAPCHAEDLYGLWSLLTLGLAVGNRRHAAALGRTWRVRAGKPGGTFAI